MLVIQLFTDIVPSAGGTYICEDGLTKMVEWLYNHPEGTNMRDGKNGESAYEVIGKECKVFTEVSTNLSLQPEFYVDPMFAANRKSWRRYPDASTYGLWTLGT